MHHTLVLDALAAGKHVLVEKPLALTVAACDVIVKAAGLSNRVVAVSENYRRIASNRAVGHKIRSGELGQLDAMFVRNISSTSRGRRPAGGQVVPPAWYHDRNRAGGFHALERGVHEADLQHFWFGEIDTVSGDTQIFGPHSRHGSNVDEDMLTATLTFKSGFVSHLSFCSAMPGVAIADRLIVGEETLARSGAWHAWQDGIVLRTDGRASPLDNLTAAYIEGLGPGERAWMFPSGAWDEKTTVSSSVQPLTYGVGISIYDFARAVRLNSQPEITAEVGRLAVATCCAMQESADMKAPVKLADVLAGKIAGAQLSLNRVIGLA
jgi:predicted dehydrogenase